MATAQSSFLRRLLRAMGGAWSFAFKDIDSGAQAAYALDLALAGGIVPIGAIIAWTNHLTGTPALPKGWKLCDGTAIVDPESPLNGQTAPMLNIVAADPIFLAGYSISQLAIVGANMPTHTHGGSTLAFAGNALGTHSHEISTSATTGGTFAAVAANNRIDDNLGGTTRAVSAGTPTGSISGNTGAPNSNSNGSNSNFPNHQKVMWIMRIK